MKAEIVLPLTEANLLRQRIRRLSRCHEAFTSEKDPHALHDLRVASRRLRELLDYLGESLPDKPRRSLRSSAKKLTRLLGKPREAEINLSLIRQFRKHKS